MPKKPDFPSYMDDRDGWHVRIDGQRHFLGGIPKGGQERNCRIPQSF